MRSIILVLMVLLSACATASADSAAPAAHTHAAAPTAPNISVELVGPDFNRLSITVADLAAGPRETITMAIHGQTYTFEGVALTTLLARVGAPTGENLRGLALPSTVLVTARDGYRVALALAETDPGMTSRKIILADTMDGAPIGAEDGPFRLVVEGDLRPARSARMVSRIEVRLLQ